MVLEKIGLWPRIYKNGLNPLTGGKTRHDQMDRMDQMEEKKL